MNPLLREPFDSLGRIGAVIDEFFNEALSPSLGQSTSGTHIGYPPVDILESRDAYLIRAEVPGMKKEDINLEFSDGVVTLTGERKFDEPAVGVQYHRSERVAGSFSRSFQLPKAINQDEMRANYQDGILEIHIQKADEAKPKQIAIKVN